MANLERARRILADLVAFPTVSSDSNLKLITYVSEIVSEADGRIAIHADDTGTKANLFATFGPEADGGIVLSGHTDVVPVDGQDWGGDPFVLREAGGRLYGRGTCDMKGFIACCLAMVPTFAEASLKRPVHFAFTYDEEVGCFGARALMNELQRSGLRPSAAIIGEPTMMGIIEGHKGCFEYTTEFRGVEGHASRPGQGINAVEYAARYISRLMEIAEQLKERAPVASPFQPPWTTLQVGRIEGGSARNVIAGHCSVEWEMRPVQQSDAVFVKDNIDAYVEDILKPAMKAVSENAEIVTHTIGEVEGLQPVAESEARRIVSALTGLTEAEVVAFGTEAGLYQSAGIPAVICGPGSIEQAHKPDEFVAESQLAACLGMLARLPERLV